MTSVRCIDRDGRVHDVPARAGLTVMEVLRDGNMAVPAVCGGNCSCGTCHVYVDARWLPLLPPQAEDERLLIEGEAAEPRPTSRLSCQIPFELRLDGLEVTLAPLP
jgi:2Fe-2S ferredoxin